MTATPTDTVPQVSTTPVMPLAVNADGAGALFGVSRSSWFRLISSGKAPAGFSIGTSKRWRIDDLRRWAELGFPDRAAFDAAIEDRQEADHR